MTVGSDETLMPEHFSGSDEPRHNSVAVNVAVGSLDHAALDPSEEIASRTFRKDYGGLAVIQQGVMLDEILYDRSRNAPIN